MEVGPKPRANPRAATKRVLPLAISAAENRRKVACEGGGGSKRFERAGNSAKGKVRALGFMFWPLFFSGIGPKVTAAVYVDNGYEFYRLHRSGDRSIDAQLTNLTLGFAVGSDF